MLFSTVAFVSSLAGVALAGSPATGSLAKRGDYGYEERAVHKVTVGKLE